MRVSIIIPACNEAGNIGRLVEEIFAEVPADILGEVIVIDDNSDDSTRDEVCGLLPQYENLRYLRHVAQSGQSAALRTGMLEAAFPIIATMDGDGQNDPRDIAKLRERLVRTKSEGIALVGGIRSSRSANKSRRFASIVANWVRNLVLRDNCPDTGCGIKVCWRESLMMLPCFTTMHRFLPALFLAQGHKVDYVPVNDRPRLAGYSKYTNFGRALIGLYDLFGVAWLNRRTKVSSIAEDSASGKQAANIG